MKCLQKEHKLRPTAEELLNHKWFHQIKYQVTPTQSAVQQAIKNLSIYQAGENLWQIMNSFIVSQFQYNQTTLSLDSAFKTLDMNHDGMIDKNDLFKFMSKEQTDEDSTWRKVESIFLNVDTDKSGSIDYSKFI